MLVCGLVVGLASPAIAQSVRVSVPEENFRKEPRVTSSNRLATVFEGAVLAVESRQSRWVRSTLEGWIWTPSVSTTDRDGFDLIVSKPGGENLREAPAGDARRVARLLRGMLLDRVAERENWTRVRRTAWLWSQSTIETQGATPLPTVSRGDPAEPVPGGNETPVRPAGLPDRVVVSGANVSLHVSPAGDTLAALRPEAALEVLAREGSWARVKLEGWVWIPCGFRCGDGRAHPARHFGQSRAVPRSPGALASAVRVGRDRRARAR